MFLDKVRVLIFSHRNRVRSMFFEFLYIVEEGGSPVKLIPEGLLPSSLLDKVRVLILALVLKLRVLILTIKTEFVLCFWIFCR